MSWRIPILSGVLIAAIVVITLAGLVMAFQSAHADVIYPGVKVGGIHVGGMSDERALAELRPVYEARMERPLRVEFVGVVRQADLEDLGATLSVQHAVDAAFSIGRTDGWREQLVAQVDASLNGIAVDAPAIQLDQTRLRAYLSAIAAEVDRPVREAELEIEDDLELRITSSVVGRKVDVDAGMRAMQSAIIGGTPSVTIPVVETQPKRVDADIAAAAKELSALLSGPVDLEFEDTQWTLSAAEIRDLLTLEERPGGAVLEVSLQEETVRKLVDSIAAEIDQKKVDARFDWNGGNLTMLRSGQDGRAVDRDKALSALLAAMKGEQRVVALPVNVTKAAGDSIDPNQLGIRDQIEFAQTPLAGVAEKVHNVKLAASRLNGVLLAPGDTFSFNEELGPTTLKSGFQTGFAISVNGGEMQTVPSVAGGICQVATTLLHAVFWAGYQIEERYPHMYWIPNYGLPPKGMVGLDATVDDPYLDFKFTNNTDDYLLIQSQAANNILEFALYGQKPEWRVDVEGPIISNVVKADPKMITEVEPTWLESRRIQVESAQDGKTVRIIRRVTSGGEVRTLELKSDYRASRNVTLVGGIKLAPTPDPTPGPGTPVPAPAEGTPVPGDSTATPPVEAAPTQPAEESPAPDATPTPGEQPPPAPTEEPIPSSTP